MNHGHRPSILALSVAACVAALVVSSGGCVDASLDVGSPLDAGTSGSFTSSDAAEEASSSTPAALCVATECPYPYTTCSDRPALPCGTNLLNDPANCGACGVSCEGFEPINMSGRCVQGQCQLECLMVPEVLFVSPPRIWKNCDGMLDDGCEVDVYSDPENCGACGNACKPGVRCQAGKCGCPTGQTDCNGRCVDLRSDENNCGACSNVCPWPVGCDDLWTKNASPACVDSACGHIVCNTDWADCNNDLHDCATVDGCETNTITNDNCGGCGVKCGPNETCRPDGFGHRCIATCESVGLADCGTGGCRDLRSDVDTCGSCSHKCPEPKAHQQKTCHKGTCELECLPGWADCNGDPNDGCEIDLNAHPANCGACGNRCNVEAGQPCIEGKCLMRECGPVEAK